MFLGGSCLWVVDRNKTFKDAMLGFKQHCATFFTINDSKRWLIRKIDTRSTKKTIVSWSDCSHHSRSNCLSNSPENDDLVNYRSGFIQELVGAMEGFLFLYRCWSVDSNQKDVTSKTWAGTHCEWNQKIQRAETLHRHRQGNCLHVAADGPLDEDGTECCCWSIYIFSHVKQVLHAH